MSNSIVEAGWLIAAVERETGLSKDILRMWERRYGFPAPARDGQGDRLYSMAEVGRLRTLAKLIDLGHRPGRLMQLDDSALDALLATPMAKRRPRAGSSDATTVLGEILLGHRLPDLRQWLEQRSASEGRPALALALLEIAEQLRVRFLDGELSVFEMDLFAAEAMRVVYVDPIGGPGVVLIAADAEVGYLELHLIQAIIAGAGSACILLPYTEKPFTGLQRLLQDGQPLALCLVFSPTARPRQIISVMDMLRPALPPEIREIVTLAGTQAPPVLDVKQVQSVAAGKLAVALQQD